MCPTSEQYEQVCKREFASIHAKLDRMDEAIRGNGKPGLQTRLDRLERANATRAAFWWMILGALITFLAGVVSKLILGR